MRNGCIAAGVVYCLVCACACCGEFPLQEVSLPLTEVVVTPGEAIVSRAGEVRVPAGRSRIRVLDLPPALLQDSLQVEMGEGVFLEMIDLSLVSIRKLLPEELQQLSERIDILEYERKKLEDRHRLLGTELAVLQAFSPGGRMDSESVEEAAGHAEANPRALRYTNTVLDAGSWLAVTRFIASRAESTRQDLAEVAGLKKQSIQQLAELKAKQKELRRADIPARLVADLTMVSEKAAQVPCTLRYMVDHVIWYPVYEFRADSTGTSVSLDRQALVAQNTGEDWTGVRLSLRTLPPERAVDIPPLAVWQIGYSQLHDSVESSRFGGARPSEEAFGPLASVPGPESLWLQQRVGDWQQSLAGAFGYRDSLAEESIRMGMATLAGVGGGGRFRFRSGGGRRNAVRRGGGSRHTESAVDKTLQFLARSQRSDGSWNDTGSARYTTGLTSLSLLAFLGSGNSSRFGKYRQNVQAANAYLTGSTTPAGQLGTSLFDQAIGAAALAESFGMDEKSQCGDAARRALLHLDRMLRPRIALLIPGLQGSRYPNGVENLAFAAMAVKSAKVCGLPVPASLLRSIRILADQVEQNQGGHRAAAAVALTRTFLGADRAAVSRYMPRLLAELPEWDPGKMHLGYIYVGTLVSFSQGTRSAAWRKWNSTMKQSFFDVLKGEKTKVWPAQDIWFGSIRSRVGTNAMAALLFEVYYRYKEVHESGGIFDPVDEGKWMPVAPQVAAAGRLYSFSAEGLRTVRADGQYHRIPIDMRKVNGTTRHVTVPVVYDGVYLQSELTNPYSDPLLEGVGRIFLAGEYIGETRVPGAAPGAAVAIPLGEDPNVRVERTIREMAGPEVKGSKLRTLGVDIQIAVRNDLKRPIRVEVHDRLATSTDTRVRVRNPRLSGGKTRAVREDGTAFWQGHVPAASAMQVLGHYEVEYPDDITPQLKMDMGELEASGPGSAGPPALQPTSRQSRSHTNATPEELPW